ncbi:MAG: hypothetical protein QOK10_3680 [Pseudonocardiales bacterium]|jgi:hypothetical protein|nr:hypothetical protein [Pseudonocardiales bacterium]
MRNIGGRATPEALRSWALLGRLGAGQPASGGHLAILHHTTAGSVAARHRLPPDLRVSPLVGSGGSGGALGRGRRKKTTPAIPSTRMAGAMESSLPTASSPELTQR